MTKRSDAADLKKFVGDRLHGLLAAMAGSVQREVVAQIPSAPATIVDKKVTRHGLQIAVAGVTRTSEQSEVRAKLEKVIAGMDDSHKFQDMLSKHGLVADLKDGPINAKL